jgi:hypothetical protein
MGGGGNSVVFRLRFSRWHRFMTNGLGASLILVSLTFEFNLSAFFIEVFWLVISTHGIVRYLLRNKSRLAAKQNN